MNIIKIYFLFLTLSISLVSAHAIDYISIDSINLSSGLQEYDNFKKLKVGLMYDTFSEKAGVKSNIVILGHRYTDRFGPKINTLANIDKIKIGDIFKVTKDNGEIINYRVFDNFVVGPYDDWVTYDHDTQEEILTIYSCAPMWDNSFRYIIKAVRINNASSSNSINNTPDSILRNYEMQESKKKAIFNPVSGVEPKILYVKKGESFDVIESNKKKYTSRVYKYDQVGDQEIKGSNGKVLKIRVE